jgi:hypothetical protein
MRWRVDQETALPYWLNTCITHCTQPHGRRRIRGGGSRGSRGGGTGVIRKKKLREARCSGAYVISRNSILYRTGQAWKLRSLLGAYVAAVMAFADQWLRDSRWFLPVMCLATLVAAVSLAIPWWGIKCPTCGARWFWLAISKRHAEGWKHWLSSQSTCPVCGYNGGILRRPSEDP